MRELGAHAFRFHVEVLAQQPLAKIADYRRDFFVAARLEREIAFRVQSHRPVAEICRARAVDRRGDAGERARVYDRIAALTPVPAGVTREKALALDAATLTRWREELAWTW